MPTGRAANRHRYLHAHRYTCTSAHIHAFIVLDCACAHRHVGVHGPMRVCARAHMLICMYAHVHTSISACCICIAPYTRTGPYVHMHTYLSEHMSGCIQACISTILHAYRHTGQHAKRHICVCAYLHASTPAHNISAYMPQPELLPRILYCCALQCFASHTTLHGVTMHG